ncbi:MAG: cupredoxin domain-containing protein [Anaerolineales bacterium]|nr:MAG: cupredoxin domain-containing protein [Anaerolineales bacterium]
MKKISFLLTTILMIHLASCRALPTTFNVILSDYQYTPNAITVQEGKEITLNLQNDGFVSHMFIIFKLGTDAGEKYGPEDEENIYWKVQVLPGKSATATFTAPSEAGEYFVTCGLGGHHEVGMIGKLIVVDQ